MLVVDHESTGDQNFCEQRHAAYDCCTREAHAKVWGFSFFYNWVEGLDQTDVVNVLDSD